MMGLHERFLAAATVGLLSAASAGYNLPFAATCDGTAVSWEDDEALPPRLRRGAWNLVRLTGRGLDVQDESFAVAIRPDAIAIRFR